MKFVLATAAVLAATSVSAADLNVGGLTLSAGGEVDMNYTTGVEEWAMELTPYVGTEFMGVGLSVETTVDLMKLDTEGADVFTGLTLGSSYVVMDKVSLYGEVDTNKDLEFGDAKMGVSFKF